MADHDDEPKASRGKFKRWLKRACFTLAALTLLLVIGVVVVVVIINWRGAGAREGLIEKINALGIADTKLEVYQASFPDKFPTATAIDLANYPQMLLEHPDLDDEYVILFGHDGYESAPTPRHMAATQKFFELNASYSAYVDALTDRENPMWLPQTKEPVHPFFHEDLGRLRAIARWYSARAEFALHNDQPDVAADALLRQLKIVAVAQDAPDILGQLVRTSIVSLALRMQEYVLKNTQLEKRVLDELIASMSKLRRQMIDVLHYSLETELVLTRHELKNFETRVLSTRDMWIFFIPI